jgi:hypothetical protein
MRSGSMTDTLGVFADHGPRLDTPLNDIRIAFLESAQRRLMDQDFAVLPEVADFVRRYPADHEAMRFLGNALEMQAYAPSTPPAERGNLLARAGEQYAAVAALQPGDARSLIDVAQNLLGRGLADAAAEVINGPLASMTIDDAEIAEELADLVDALHDDADPE